MTVATTRVDQPLEGRLQLVYMSCKVTTKIVLILKPKGNVHPNSVKGRPPPIQMRRGRQNHPVLFNTSFQKPFRIGLGAPKYVLHMVSAISIAIRIALRVLEELYYWKKNDFIIEKKCKSVKFTKKWSYLQKNHHRGVRGRDGKRPSLYRFLCTLALMKITSSYNILLLL